MGFAPSRHYNRRIVTLVADVASRSSQQHPYKPSIARPAGRAARPARRRPPRARTWAVSVAALRSMTGAEATLAAPSYVTKRTGHNATRAARSRGLRRGRLRAPPKPERPPRPRPHPRHAALEAASQPTEAHAHTDGSASKRISLPFTVRVP
ncbi:hypothetical protein EVAR_26445_1 [Eumeta japonica]|uniref:Uncharacterized protein n=1 Tax=Eumeta variegata TaxID=151549 RepID=A0A4C1VQF5_EUMVA|nr:hypothetical protein EVAR_26445_1 [Eumeta japonica]